MVVLSHLPGIAAIEQFVEVASTPRADGLINLRLHLIFEGRAADIAEHTDRFREFRVPHTGEQVDQRGVGLFVMEQKIIFSDTGTKRDHFGTEPIEANAFIAILAKDHRLAMLQFQRRLLASVAVLRIAEGTIVEDVAILIHLDHRSPTVIGSSLQCLPQMLDVGID